MAYVVKFVDSAYVGRNGGELVPEYDMSHDSSHSSLEAAEARRKEIERNDPGSKAWVD